MSDADHRDELPEDLDPGSFVGVYHFPDNRRRRVPATLYLGAGLASILGWAVAGDGAVLVSDGFLWAGVALVAFAGYGFLAARPLAVDESEALVAAVAEVGFPVGHASAQMGWRGWLSRPVWKVLVFSADDPPTSRALVLVDAVDASVLGHVVDHDLASDDA